MKKVIANTQEPIVFLVRGVRNTPSAVEYVIDEVGVTMKDEDARVIEERLGGLVTISDIDVAGAKKEAEEALKAAEKAAKEAEKAAKKAEKEAAEKAAKEAEKANQ